MDRKGIILSGGSGTRLYPITKAISKQLIPVFDKPMIYYSLSVMMLSGIREILLISTPHDIEGFKRLLGNGSKWGMTIEYAVQDFPGGLAEAFIVGEFFIKDKSSAMILGDNIFYGSGIIEKLRRANDRNNGATIFTYNVEDPTRYGVAEFDENGNVVNIQEKPKNPASNFAVTGLYFYDNNVVEYAKSLKPSKRGELEITDLNLLYIKHGNMFVEKIGRGNTWFDMGTNESLLEANQFVQAVEQRQGVKIACPEEIAFYNRWINVNELGNLAQELSKSKYGEYLMKLVRQHV